MIKMVKATSEVLNSIYSQTLYTNQTVYKFPENDETKQDETSKKV